MPDLTAPHPNQTLSIHPLASHIMPIAVARADKTSYYSSFGTNSSKHYKTSTTSKATPVLTEWEPKPNSTKPAPVLPPPSMKNGARNVTCIRRPLPSEEGIQDKNSVEDIPDNSARPLCDDVLRQSFHSDLLTPTAREVLRYLILPSHSQSLMEFPGVGLREFKLIEHAVGETGRISRKPRLSYDYNKRLLIVDMPSILHKRFFDHLKDAMAAYFLFLPYDRELISPFLSMNYSLKLRDQVVTPDLTMTITAVENAPKAHVFTKVEDEIIAHPEAVLAIIVIIREAINYQCPKDISTASISLRNGRNNPKPLPLTDFLALRSMPRGFNQPIRIADHDWAYLASVEYFMWVKGVNQARIDVHNTNPQFMAHSMLGSVLQMDAISAMLQRGMDKVRDMMARFSRTLNIAGDFSTLEEAEVRLPLNWSISAKFALTAADLTAHERYESWHDVRFKGAKRTKQNHNPPYSPSESDHDGGSSESATPPPPRTCSRRTSRTLCKCVSTSQPPPRKSRRTKGKARNTDV
ncbi:uncharacterized protein F5147DRAFT_778058 [Suillus discolor]|uniref:Uncharacterized protein n=1 Tax=Suillus discolor TaxID=1912936 RepID=A0A9P7EY53_9AGAM|nr:uncharacterized protein F5147DRAFT_778058 [Suillus discolor]KAG2097255.1 hypothetical protein F5147DRAFT_778058 [Suillus discolor]